MPSTVLIEGERLALVIKKERPDGLDGSTVLWRPTGPDELELVRRLDWLAWPVGCRYSDRALGLGVRIELGLLP
jgi:hypothetical protein